MADSHQQSVLLVEDNWILATELAQWLKSAGVKLVGPAATLALARELAQRPLDAAIVDLNLGGERADPLIYELRERGVPVIVLSGYTPSHGVREQASAALTKPSSREEVLAALRAVSLDLEPTAKTA